MNSRLSKLIIGAMIVGFFLSVFVAFAIGATIADWPEADAWTALNAREEQKAWDKPGDNIVEMVLWPIVRATVTIYDDKYNEPGLKRGFLALTHASPAEKKTATFYYNVTLAERPGTVVFFTKNETWDMAYWQVPQN